MNAPATFASWSPRNGETIHLSARNRWSLPAGRYRLERERGGDFQLHGVTVAGWASVHPAALREEERLGALEPISAGELARERQTVELRAVAPLRAPGGRVIERQHDASDLALFRAANEPRLL